MALFQHDLLYLRVHLCIIYMHKESILAFAGENRLKCEITIRLLTTKEQVNSDAWTYLCLYPYTYVSMYELVTCYTITPLPLIKHVARCLKPIDGMTIFNSPRMVAKTYTTEIN